MPLRGGFPGARALGGASWACPRRGAFGGPSSRGGSQAARFPGLSQVLTGPCAAGSLQPCLGLRVCFHMKHGCSVTLNVSVPVCSGCCNKNSGPGGLNHSRLFFSVLEALPGSQGGSEPWDVPFPSDATLSRETSPGV